MWLINALGLMLAGGFILPAFFSPPRHWKIVGWTCAWAANGVILLYTGLKSVFAKEYVRLAHGQLYLGMIFSGRTQVIAYDVNHIHHLQLSTEDTDCDGRLCFEYHDDLVDFGYNITVHDAKKLLNALSHCVTIPYHSVERVVFGYETDNTQTSCEENAVDTCLDNPEVAQLIYPLLNLRELRIYADTADSQHIEQFLTYGLTALGQQYLSAHVTVSIHGTSQKLPVNVRNSLTNVCQRVIYIP